ncbi:hypothetical protein [Ruegeria sp.]|uniref:hypothetical protein n=1 Tax=Ruegeria sp. TaxID=1879320 RepID=UPI003B5C12BB
MTTLRELQGIVPVTMGWKGFSFFSSMFAQGGTDRLNCMLHLALDRLGLRESERFSYV